MQRHSKVLLPSSICTFVWKRCSSLRALYRAAKIRILEHHAALNYGIVYHIDRQQLWNWCCSLIQFYTSTMLSKPKLIVRLIHLLYQIFETSTCFFVSNQPTSVWRREIFGNKFKFKLISIELTLYWSKTKYSAKMSVWLRHCNTAFIKHVFPLKKKKFKMKIMQKNSLRAVGSPTMVFQSGHTGNLIRRPYISSEWWYSICCCLFGLKVVENTNCR